MKAILFSANAGALLYTGNVSVTNGGRICQKWAEQTPHSHLFNTNKFFPNDSSVKEALNYCRQPNNDIWPWCYTTDCYRQRQYCDKHIPSYGEGMRRYRVKSGNFGHQVFANSGNPDETAPLSRLIRIFTVCLVIFLFQ